MSDDRFSSAPAPSGDNRFGYFAAPGATTGSPFGGPPAAPAASPFGGPPAEPAQPGAPLPVPPGPATFGSPYAATPPAPAPKRRGFRLRPVILGVVALVLLGGAFQGYRSWKQNQPITMPTTLAGLPRATDPKITTLTADLGTKLQQENKDLTTLAAAYSTPGDLTNVLMVAVGRGHTDISKDFSDTGGQFGAPTQVGASSCAVSSDKGATVCERTSGDLTAIVVSIGSKGPQTPEAVSAAVDELWRSL